MPKHKKSSSSPCINMESLNLNSQPKTLRLGHRRSASDSALASLLKTINFELGPRKSFSAEKADLSTTGVQECSHFNAPKKSPLPSDKNKSIEDDVPLVLNDSSKCESSTAAYHHKWDRKINPGMNPKKMRRLFCILSFFLSHSFYKDIINLYPAKRDLIYPIYIYIYTFSVSPIIILNPCIVRTKIYIYIY